MCLREDLAYHGSWKTSHYNGNVTQWHSSIAYPKLQATDEETSKYGTHQSG